jgi:hypothetical protein
MRRRQVEEGDIRMGRIESSAPLLVVNIAAAAYIFLLAISQLIDPDIGGSDAL